MRGDTVQMMVGLKLQVLKGERYSSDTVDALLYYYLEVG
jgi:hypothetical protein